MEKKTILIVDDAPENLVMLTEILKNQYAVKAAPRGAIALKIAQSRPDLIFLDIIMPEMDGYEVCRRLKEDEKTNDIPVIFLSSNTGEDEIEKGMAQGAVHYISKPFDADTVLNAAKRFIR